MENDLTLQNQAIAAEFEAPSDDLIKALNRVIAKAINSREEFLTFAGKAESQPLFRLCMDIKERREALYVELQHRVSGMGGEPATEENFAGWLHHLWLRTRLALEQDNDFVIVSEAVREEESMRLALEESIQEPSLPADIRAQFTRERDFSSGLHDSLEKLKETLKPDDFVDINRV